MATISDHDPYADRRREARTAPVSEREAAVLETGWATLEATLWDVSAHGARIHVPRGDYLGDEERLSRTLEASTAIRVRVVGEPESRSVTLRWHGLSRFGGYVIGAELLPGGGPTFGTGDRPAPPMPVMWSVFGRGGRLSWLNRE